MDYYLYSHSNSDGRFYIGKGRSGRADLWSRTKEWKKIAAKGYTTKIEANGTEKDILALEKIVIKSLVEQGVKLVNKIYNKNWSKPFTEEHKKKMSISSKGHKNAMFRKFGDKHPLFGYKHTQEAIEKNRQAHLGKTHTDEAKKKIGIASSIRNRKRGQHNKLAKANNYRRENEI